MIVIIIIIIIIIIKECGEKAQIQELRHRDRTNVEPEMYDHTGNNWSHWNSNTELKEKSASYTRNTSNRLFTKDGYTWNITHTAENTTVWNLKPERWGSTLVQETYQEERACDK